MLVLELLILDFGTFEPSYGWFTDPMAEGPWTRHKIVRGFFVWTVVSSRWFQCFCSFWLQFPMAVKHIWWELWFSWCKQYWSSLHDQITTCFEHLLGITDIVMVSALEPLVPFLKFKAQGLTLQLPMIRSWIARSDNDVRGFKKNVAGLTTTCECGYCHIFLWAMHLSFTEDCITWMH